ncbi:MAG: hypothetical protein ACFB2W_14270 [Leptolyngbyaceae cyanobacterium]
MGLEIPLLLGALYCFLNFIRGSNREPHKTELSLRTIRQTLGHPDESTPYKDTYKLPDGQIILYYYPPE